MEKLPAKIMIVAGEESGDMRAASLIKAIRNYAPQTRFFGIAGERCRKEGVDTFTDITGLAIIGFFEVIKHYPEIKKVFDQVLRKTKEERPDLAILVDYPGFNLRLAKELRKLGIKVIYYVSPQVWAWKASRVKLIKQCVDRMLVLFTFEEEFYAKHGYKADFVGHPLLDEVRADRRPSDILNNLGLSEKKPTLALLPGSREKEISRHLPVMLRAAALLQKQRPELQVILLQAKNIKGELFQKYLKTASPAIKATTDYYNGLNCADLCVVASGTATLEAAIMGKPMVVIYRTSWPTWLIAKLAIRIPHIALVNIVAGRKIVEELIQTNASPQRIANAISIFLNKPEEARKVRNELAGIRARLGTPGASQRAAKIVLAELTH